MSHTETAPAQTPEGQALDFKLEVVVLPVSDVDRAGVTSIGKARDDAPEHADYAEYTVRERAREELPS